MDEDFYEFYKVQRSMGARFAGRIKHPILKEFMADMKTSLDMLDRENNAYLMRFEKEQEDIKID